MPYLILALFIGSNILIIRAMHVMTSNRQPTPPHVPIVVD